MIEEREVGAVPAFMLQTLIVLEQSGAVELERMELGIGARVKLTDAGVGLALALSDKDAKFAARSEQVGMANALVEYALSNDRDAPLAVREQAASLVRSRNDLAVTDVLAAMAEHVNITE